MTLSSIIADKKARNRRKKQARAERSKLLAAEETQRKVESKKKLLYDIYLRAVTAPTPPPPEREEPASQRKSSIDEPGTKADPNPACPDSPPMAPFAPHLQQQNLVASVFCLKERWQEAKQAHPDFKWSDFPEAFTLEMPSFTTTEEGFVVYNLEMQCGDAALTVSRRYSEFYQLANSLYYNGYMRTWEFPKRTWFRTMEEDFLSERLSSLQKALTEILQIPEICRLQEMRQFLMLDSFTDKVKFSRPSLEDHVAALEHDDFSLSEGAQ